MHRASVFLLVLVGFWLPALAVSQLDGHFYLSKKKYSAGEPVYLVFEVENKAIQPVKIQTADPLSFCGGYKIEVTGAKRQERLDCYGGVGGSCASSEEVLRTGQRHTDRILLNRSYDLRQPGKYALQVSYELLYGPDDGDPTMLYTGGIHETFDAQLEIVLESSQGNDGLKPEFQKYVIELQSNDVQRRIEASQVIANLAPPFLEQTILRMLDSPELRYFAIRGLHNLGTPAAHQALVDFVKKSPPVQSVSEYQDAILYLGDIGDRNDLAVLLEVAHANPPDSYSREVAMESAGRVGGDDAVPLLVAELKHQSIDVRQSAVRALYSTGSRAAVPVLLELLRSPNERVSGTAEFGLQVLTHYTATEPNSGIKPEATYAKWSQWWNTHRESATIFKYDECGDIVPLD